FIGTDPTGTQALGNGAYGITMFGGRPHANTIGGDAGTPGTPPGNVISGNGVAGIALYSGDNNLIAGNTIEANATDGIQIIGAGNSVSNNLIAYHVAGNGIVIGPDTDATN